MSGGGDVMKMIPIKCTKICHPPSSRQLKYGEGAGTSKLY